MSGEDEFDLELDWAESTTPIRERIDHKVSLKPLTAYSEGECGWLKLSKDKESIVDALEQLSDAFSEAAAEIRREGIDYEATGNEG
jgi:hypothetical protein